MSRYSYNRFLALMVRAIVGIGGPAALAELAIIYSAHYLIFIAVLWSFWSGWIWDDPPAQMGATGTKEGEMNLNRELSRITWKVVGGGLPFAVSLFSFNYQHPLRTCSIVGAAIIWANATGFLEGYFRGKGI